MRSKFTWILTLFFALMMQVGFAQKQVTGVVKTQDGDPIPGATVMLVGTNLGTDTDDEGKYTLNLKKGDKIRVVFGGFKPTTLTVSDSGVLNVTLVEEDITELEGIVVDTYRTVSKPKNSNAVSTVTSKTIEGRPNASFIQTLQGQVPGLNISTGSGQPGDNNTTVILRGLGSINGNVEPLYVIDGVPMSSDRFRSLNPNDIDRIDVLKDAGATAIYGNRGANGVIVVTTKRASFDSSLEVKYVGTTGMSFLQDNQYNLMNAKQYVDFQRKFGIPNRQLTSVDPNAPTINYTNPVDGNWVDVFFRNAIAQNHTLSFSSGSKNLNNYTSIGYSDIEGVLKTTGLKRFNFRTNLNGKSDNGKLTYGTTVSANFSKSDMASSAGSNALNQNYFMGAFQGLPYLRPDMYNGTFDSAFNALRVFSNGSMPILLMDKMRTNGLKQEEFKTIVNGSLNYAIDSNWSIGTNLGADYQTINQFSFNGPSSFNSFYFAAADQEWLGSIGNIDERRLIMTSNSNIKWNKTFGKHSVNAGAYIEYLKAHFKSSSISKEGFDPNFWENGKATGWIGDSDQNDYYAPSASVGEQSAGMFSYFGLASYDYDTKYGLDVTLRRDASFRFIDENRWGTFWSVSGRWNIINEKFMEGSTVFSDLKLRASHGTAGNQDITGSGVFGSAYLYTTLYSAGRGYADEPNAYALSQLPKRDLRWEEITTTNIGLDFALFNNRLRGNVDVYRKQTDDLYQPIPLSAINGSTSIFGNFGSLRNEGVELLLAGDIVRNKDLTITLNANGSYNKNQVLNLPNGEGFTWNGSSLSGMREGGRIGEFYLYKYAGINPQNGETQYYDKNGAITENPTDEDRQWLNKSSLPVYQGSFGFDVNYKGFFAQANFTFAKDIWRFDNDYFFFTQPSSVGMSNMTNDYQDYWTTSNRDAAFSNPNANNLYHLSDSDFYLRDASYIRMRFVTVGYNFKKSDLAFMKLSGLRVYAQAENLVTWTKWKGWDAESNRGVDLSQYPTPRTVSFGVEVQF
ncbi:SusC/RagA family TonB-linked outer membrane protein [Paenimyroides baculatum]|uniref:SusC/RagA family TonB-linked outer membrane protein n=1 Tax=Paenimyroides baculatum TaxID=2608000 RepID=A0A5M6CD12_9FLAO|nr:SusC/RagA family TonB-linked outer membrane protein [Paenimyroides baculatum]KAA5532873.1 SusC/RagA family TonB-linked outer membrane protein [Paenimyroides baculatum]